VVSKVSYLWLYPDATMGALAIGLVVELIPLSGILLGLTVLKGTPTMPSPMQPARMDGAAETARKPRARKLRVVGE
jgi:hypothetical protein